MQGHYREADAIRACRLLGGAACDRILTINEVHALLDVANGAGGDPAKVQEGVNKNPLLAGLKVATGAARVAPRGPPPAPAAGWTPHPAQLGVLVLLTMVVQYGQLQDLARFEETLTKFDYVILESPKSVYCNTCHPTAMGPSPRSVIEWELDWWAPPTAPSSPYVLAETRYPRWATEEQRRLIDSGRATWSEASGWNGPTSEADAGGPGFRVRGFESGGAVQVSDPRLELNRPGALFLLAQSVHDPTGTSIPMRRGASGPVRISAGPGITQRAIAITEIELPGGGRTYCAAGNDARLSPAEIASLVAAGVPRANIFSGAMYRTANPLENHAEQVILRHMPPGARIVRWGISWAGPLKGEPCGYCEQHGVDRKLVETREMVEALLGL